MTILPLHDKYKFELNKTKINKLTENTDRHQDILTSGVNIFVIVVVHSKIRQN